MRSLVFITILLLSISSCEEDKCRSYSEFSCEEIDKADYNVYFSFGGNKESYFLGEAKGLSGCGSVAYGYAAQHNLYKGDDWSYICCMIARGSSCYEKHR